MRAKSGGSDDLPPFFCMKPADAIVHNGATLPFPQMTYPRRRG